MQGLFVTSPKAELVVVKSRLVVSTSLAVGEKARMVWGAVGSYVIR